MNLRACAIGAALALYALPLSAAEQPAGETAGAPADKLAQGPDVAGLLQVLLALLVVLGLIFVLAWAVKRIGGWQVGGAGAVRVLGGQSLGQRERVVLVQVGETQLLLGVAPGRISTLHVLDEPVQPPAGAPAGAESFAERLGAALKRQQGGGR